MAGRKSDFTLPTNTLDELFSTQEERDDAIRNIRKRTRGALRMQKKRLQEE